VGPETAKSRLRYAVSKLRHALETAVPLSTSPAAVIGIKVVVEGG
jgi:hypothetical protein